MKRVKMSRVMLVFIAFFAIGFGLSYTVGRSVARPIATGKADAPVPVTDTTLTPEPFADDGRKS